MYETRSGHENEKKYPFVIKLTNNTCIKKQTICYFNMYRRWIRCKTELEDTAFKCDVFRKEGINISRLRGINKFNERFWFVH